MLDRRAGEEMSEFCLAHGIRLLAYGTLGGGFLSERWVGQAEPPAPDIADWSKMKYRRFIQAIGGWEALQAILSAAHRVAKKHGVSIANVATRWILDQPAVAAVIVGARLGEREHREDNLRSFAFDFDAEDRALMDSALARSTRIPGDCGDEYRKPPYLTASGDLSHHLAQFPSVYKATPVPDRPERLRIDTGSIWEPLAGYSRAVRLGDRILVSGTTATHGAGEVVCPGDAAGQAVYILDKIAASLSALGASLDDVIRTRIYLKGHGAMGRRLAGPWPLSRPYPPGEHAGRRRAGGGLRGGDRGRGGGGGLSLDPFFFSLAPDWVSGSRLAPIRHSGESRNPGAT